MYIDVLFDGTDLTEIEGFSVNSIITDRLPDIQISSGKLARQDGVKIYNKEYGSKKITIEGYITTSSRNAYLLVRDQLIRYTEPRNKVLRVPMDGTPLEYTATVSNLIFSDVGGGFARASIEFICTDPYGYDVNRRTLVNGTTTTSATNTFSYLESIGGVVATPPLITVSVASVTGSTGKYITLTNNAGETITVTRTWANNDVLEIDCLNHTVKVNTVLTNYTGVFWNLNIDDYSMIYADNFTTRTIGMRVSYRRRSL